MEIAGKGNIGNQLFRRKVAWLKSDGNQYITFRRPCFSGTEEYELVGRFEDFAEDRKICGYSYYGQHDGKPVVKFSGKYTIATYQGKWRPNMVLSEHWADAAFHSFGFSGNGFSVDSELVSASAPSQLKIDGEIAEVTDALFGIYDEQVGSDPRVIYADGKNCKICRYRETSRMQFDLIPVIALDGRPAMFDLVSNRTYYNLGTGEFEYGEEME